MQMNFKTQILIFTYKLYTVSESDSPKEASSCAPEHDNYEVNLSLLQPFQASREI